MSDGGDRHRQQGQSAGVEGRLARRRLTQSVTITKQPVAEGGREDPEREHGQIRQQRPAPLVEWIEADACQGARNFDPEGQPERRRRRGQHAGQKHERPPGQRPGSEQCLHSETGTEQHEAQEHSAMTVRPHDEHERQPPETLPREEPDRDHDEQKREGMRPRLPPDARRNQRQRHPAEAFANRTAGEAPRDEPPAHDQPGANSVSKGRPPALTSP